MGKMSQAAFFFFFLGIACISQNASAKAPKEGVGAPPFNYENPANWGSVGPGYKLCSSGTQQSPINIDTKKLVSDNKLPPLKVVYKINNATLTTNGLAAQLSVKGKSDMTLEGKTFRLLNIRWHTPSEHTIDNAKYIAEMQQMFVSNEGGIGKFDIVIITTLYAIGAPDPIVAALEPEMAKLGKEMSGGAQVNGLSEEVAMANFSSALLQKIPTSNYFTYSGSLTTPPCVEQVTWFLTKPQSMTKEQAFQINQLQGKNNKNNGRPVQPLNGREIHANPI